MSENAKETFAKVDDQLPFVMIYKVVVGDARMSLKALGLYTYMQSKPAGWRFYVTEIAKNFPDGVKSVRSSMAELEELGYIERTKLRDEHGRYSETRFDIHTFPMEIEKEIPSSKEIVTMMSNLNENTTNPKGQRGRNVDTKAISPETQKGNVELSTSDDVGHNTDPVENTTNPKGQRGENVDTKAISPEAQKRHAEKGTLIIINNTKNDSFDDDDSINNTKRAQAPLQTFEKSSSPENGWTSATYETVLSTIASWGVDTSMELINRIKADVWQLENGAQTLAEQISVINRLVVAQRITHEHLAEVRNVWSYTMAVYRSLPNTPGLRVQEIYDAHAAVGTAPQRQQLTTDERVVIPTDVDIMNTDWSQFN